MNKAFGVTVVIPKRDGQDATTAPLAVVAQDERDAELVAARLLGSGATAETFRELTTQEASEYGLDLNEHGSAKALPVLNL